MPFAPLTSLGTQGPYVIVMYIRDTCSVGAENRTLEYMRLSFTIDKLKGE